jgi:hypothetical protein
MPASTPSRRKRAAHLAPRPSDGTDVLQVLVFSKLLTPPQVEPIRRVTGLNVERVVATRSDVDSLSRAFCGLKSSLKTAEQQLAASWLSVDLSDQEFLSTEQEEIDPAAAPGVRALDHILSYAFERRDDRQRDGPRHRNIN